MIKSKSDALAFLKSHKEFSDQDWIDGEFWFRYDGITDPECLRHDYMTLLYHKKKYHHLMPISKKAIDFFYCLLLTPICFEFSTRF